MKTKINFKVILYLALIAIVIFGLHLLILIAFKDFFVNFEILYSHLFLFILTVLTILGLNVIFAKVKLNLTATAFLATSIFKMLAAVLFLFPFIKHDNEGRMLFVVQFFILYFIYLFIEIFYFYRKLKEKK